jgi:hypothetical protein
MPPPPPEPPLLVPPALVPPAFVPPAFVPPAFVPPALAPPSFDPPALVPPPLPETVAPPAPESAPASPFEREEQAIDKAIVEQMITPAVTAPRLRSQSPFMILRWDHAGPISVNTRGRASNRDRCSPV